MILSEAQSTSITLLSPFWKTTWNVWR